MSEQARRLRAFLANPAHRPWLLGALAIATRAASAMTAVVIHPDSPRYLKMATLIGQSKFGEACRIWPWSHPLYSVLIAFGEVLDGNQLFVAVAISVVLGGLAAIPLYHLGRAGWGERVAVVAAILYAFLIDPVDLHSQPLPEGPFYFFFLATMALAWSALERKSWERSLLAGIGAACAWMTRPEGAYLLPLFLFAAVWRPNRFSVAATGIFLATAFVLAFPYLTFIHSETGKWGVSANPHSQGVLGLLTGENKGRGFQIDPTKEQVFAQERAIAKHGTFWGPVRYSLWVCARDLAYWGAPFLVLGFIFLRTPDLRWGPAAYLLVAGIGYAIPPCLAWFAATPFSYRYILPSMVLFLPVVAIGLVKAAGWTPWRPALAASLILACAGMTPRFMLPKNAGKIALKDGGRAILASRGPGSRILGTRREIEYYARGDWYAIEAGVDLETLVIGEIETHRIDVIALFEPDLKNCPADLKEYVEARFQFFGEYPFRREKDVAPLRLYVRRP